MTRYFRTVAGLMGTSALALTLSACKLDNRPLFGRDNAYAAYDAAPAVGPLDPAYPQTVGYLPPTQAYAYPERAYTVGRAAYSRPPSYAFSYGDSQPYAWDVADQGLMFAEPYGDDWRYYYYEPGEAYPYYVQDADYGYAYGDEGVLLAMFSAAGALIAADRYDDYHPRAGYYWTRGLDLNRSYYDAPRYAVDDTVWRSRAPVVFADYDRWYRAYETQPGWREAVRHDNGRHLGWYKDRGGRVDARQVALAAPPQSFEGGRVVERGGQGGDRGWRGDRGAQQTRTQQEVGRDDRRGGPQQRVEREARRQDQVHGQGRGQGQAHARGPDNRGGGNGREARQERAPQQQQQARGPEARNAGSNGRDAGWKGAERPQAQGGGGGHDRGGGQGGGGKDRGQGGGGGGGGGGGDKGGGHGGGHGKGGGK